MSLSSNVMLESVKEVLGFVIEMFASIEMQGAVIEIPASVTEIPGSDILRAFISLFSSCMVSLQFLASFAKFVSLK